MHERAGGRVEGRLVYVATVVGMAGVLGGTSLGLTVLAPSSVTQSAGVYGGASQAPTGFGQGPTLSPSHVLPGVAACTAGPLTETINGGTVNVTLSSLTGGTVCTAGDFAELFTVDYSAQISAGSPQTDTFTVTTSYDIGANLTTGFNSVSLTTGSPGAPWNQTINIFVDYGSVAGPTGGIATLTLVIQ